MTFFFVLRSAKKITLNSYFCHFGGLSAKLSLPQIV